MLAAEEAEVAVDDVGRVNVVAPLEEPTNVAAARWCSSWRDQQLVYMATIGSRLSRELKSSSLVA
jgi:hypothetical protein